jgi:hypothetical protein
MSDPNLLRSRIKAGELKAMKVSKSYGAAHFEKGSGQRVLVYDRARQADR